MKRYAELREVTRDLHAVQRKLATAEKGTAEYTRLWRLSRALLRRQGHMLAGRGDG